MYYLSYSTFFCVRSFAVNETRRLLSPPWWNEVWRWSRFAVKIQIPKTVVSHSTVEWNYDHIMFCAYKMSAEGRALFSRRCKTTFLCAALLPTSICRLLILPQYMHFHKEEPSFPCGERELYWQGDYFRLPAKRGLALVALHSTIQIPNSVVL